MNRSELIDEVSAFMKSELPDDDPIDLEQAALAVQEFIEELDDHDEDDEDEDEVEPEKE